MSVFSERQLPTLAMVDPQAVQAMAQTLMATFDMNTAVRQEAETYLRNQQTNPQLATTLIGVLQTPTLPEAVRQQAAIQFKLFIKRNWDIVGLGESAGLDPGPFYFFSFFLFFSWVSSSLSAYG